MFFFDTTYFWWVLVPTLVLSLFVQMHLKRTFKTWSQVENLADQTGREVAQELFDETSLDPVPIERTKQPLGDHYDPGKNVVRLSPPVGDADTVAAMAVTAHELGHVQQYQEGSGLIKARSFLIPAVQLSPTIMYGTLMMGLLFNMTNMLYVAVFFFGLTVLFSLLTLPVEFDASKRGMNLLREAELFGSEEEEAGAAKVLRAAALTYVAAFITSVLQLFYFISVVSREAKEDKQREARKQSRQSTPKRRTTARR